MGVLVLVIIGIVIIYFAFIRPFNQGVQEAIEEKNMQNRMKKYAERQERKQDTIKKHLSIVFDAQQKKKINNDLKRALHEYTEDNQREVADSSIKSQSNIKQHGRIYKKTPITKEDFLKRVYFLWDKAEMYGFPKKQIFGRTGGSEYNDFAETERKLIGDPFHFGFICPIVNHPNGPVHWEVKSTFLKVQSVDDHRIEGKSREGEKIVLNLDDTADYVKLLYSF